MRKLQTVLLAIVVGLYATAAFAQTKEDVTEYTFTDKLVEGDLISPDNTVIPVRTGDVSKSLVKVRTHFVPQMLKSVENI